MHCVLTNEAKWLHSKKLVDRPCRKQSHPKSANDHELKPIHLIEQSKKYLAVIQYPNTK